MTRMMMTHALQHKKKKRNKKAIQKMEMESQKRRMEIAWRNKKKYIEECAQ